MGLTNNYQPVKYLNTGLCLRAFSSSVGTWSYQAAAARFSNETTHADLDEFTITLSLIAGTYYIVHIGRVDTDRGIVKTYMDGTLIDTTDWYAAANAIKCVTIGPITISADGDHALKFKIDGKNGASGNHIGNFEQVLIGRSA